jgi:hypothetical protein
MIESRPRHDGLPDQTTCSPSATTPRPYHPALDFGP